MAKQSYDRIVIKDQSGNSKVTFERPLFGELTMKNDGGKTVIQKVGWLGNTKTYVPSDTESVEAES